MRQRTINLIYLILFLLLLVAPTVIRRLYFYGLGGGDRADVPLYEVADVPGRVPTPSAGEFVDEPDVSEGLILLDAAHDNES